MAYRLPGCSWALKESAVPANYLPRTIAGHGAELGAGVHDWHIWKPAVYHAEINLVRAKRIVA